jgi:hypothetical protein
MALALASSGMRGLLPLLPGPGRRWHAYPMASDDTS